MYFNECDYETFKEEYITLNTKEVRERRSEIKEKLLEINSEVKYLFKKEYDLHNHWKAENLTSLIFPCEFNHGRVDWLGVRYGRSLPEIKKLNEGKDSKDAYRGFQKYNCFQINITRTGIEMGIFHSVPNDSIDRMYVREQLDNDNLKFKEVLISEIQKLQGYGYKFNVSWLNKMENCWKNKTFGFDYYEKANVGEEFIKFYNENCIDGRYSSILYHYPRRDERIESKESIVAELKKHIERLYALYKTISWGI